MKSTVLAGRFLAFTVLLSLATLAAAQTAPTRTEVKKGNASVTTSELNGEVVDVEGNSLVVKMSSGEVRTFNVPKQRRFIVDGKELTVHELVPGTMLTATIKTTMTPITVRTITVKTGTVWHVMGNTVILTLPNGENKQFLVKDNTRFTVNGKPATVRDLSKGTVVYAEKVVEEPLTEIMMDTKVVGQAPAPAAVAAAAPAAAPTGAPAAVPAAAAPSPQAESTPEAAQAAPAEPPPAPAQQTPTGVAETPAPPKTASRVPLIVGVLLLVGILVIWLVRRGKS